MNEPITAKYQVRIDELERWLQDISQRLQATGLTAPQAEEALANHLRAVCVQCGLGLTGSEVFNVAQARKTKAPPSGMPKLNRFYQGYCGREGCDSFYYELQLAPHPAIDWQGVLDSCTAPTAAEALPPSDSGPSAPTAPPTRKTRLSPLLVVGLIVLAILLVLRFLMSGVSLPGLHQEPKYTVDPKSIRNYNR